MFRGMVGTLQQISGSVEKENKTGDKTARPKPNRVMFVCRHKIYPCVFVGTISKSVGDSQFYPVPKARMSLKRCLSKKRGLRDSPKLEAIVSFIEKHRLDNFDNEKWSDAWDISLKFFSDEMSEVIDQANLQLTEFHNDPEIMVLNLKPATAK